MRLKKLKILVLTGMFFSQLCLAEDWENIKVSGYKAFISFEDALKINPNLKVIKNFNNHLIAEYIVYKQSKIFNKKLVNRLRLEFSYNTLYSIMKFGEHEKLDCAKFKNKLLKKYPESKLRKHGAEELGRHSIGYGNEYIDGYYYRTETECVMGKPDKFVENFWLTSDELNLNLIKKRTNKSGYIPEWKKIDINGIKLSISFEEAQKINPKLKTLTFTRGGDFAVIKTYSKPGVPTSKLKTVSTYKFKSNMLIETKFQQYYEKLDCKNADKLINKIDSKGEIKRNGNHLYYHVNDLEYNYFVSVSCNSDNNSIRYALELSNMKSRLLTDRKDASSKKYKNKSLISNKNATPDDSFSGFSKESIYEAYEIDREHIILSKKKNAPFHFYSSKSLREYHIESMACKKSVAFNFRNSERGFYTEGNITVGICNEIYNKIIKFISYADAVNPKLYSAFRGRKGKVAENPALSSKIITLNDEYQMHYFLVIGIGHGAVVFPTAVIINKNTKKLIVIQYESSGLCNRNKNEKICTEPVNFLERLAKKLISRIKN